MTFPSRTVGRAVFVIGPQTIMLRMRRERRLRPAFIVLTDLSPLHVHSDG
jgi:hypothetical protein